MGTFGLRLRGERENRRLSRVDVAKTTKVRVHHLCALEHENFDDLPADGSAEDYLRTYAEYLGLDAEAFVAEFLDEARSRRPPPEDPPAAVRPVEPEAEAPPEVEETPAVEALPEVAEVPLAEPIAEAPPPLPVDEISIEPAYMADEPPSVEELPPRPTRRGPRPVVTAAVALVAVVLMVLVLRGIGGTAETPAPADITPVELSAPAEATHDAPRVEPPVDPVAVEALAVETPSREEEAPPRSVQPASTAAPSSRLSISDHGVGTAIVNKRLVGASDSFDEGTRVWFWTRVTGGRAGDRIEHVWIHEGRVMQRAGLELGGAHWRTQSKKTLFPGSAGNWVVEARDAAGNVLARRDFSCTR